MIGHLQSRKAPIIVTHFNMLHSLDSLSLAEKLSKRLVESGKNLRVLVEFNVSGEESKSGFQASDESLWTGICEEMKQLNQIPGITLSGLMTMPPFF